MTWNGSGFEGEPILLTWNDAAKLFGSAPGPFRGSELTGDALISTRSVTDYKPGKCRVTFGGFSDWRLPTAYELDLMAAYVPHNDENYGTTNERWSWGSEKNAAALEQLLPEWSRRKNLLWSASKIGGDTAWGFDGRFPLGDMEHRSKSGVIFVRSAKPGDYPVSKMTYQTI